MRSIRQVFATLFLLAAFAGMAAFAQVPSPYDKLWVYSGAVSVGSTSIPLEVVILHLKGTTQYEVVGRYGSLDLHGSYYPRTSMMHAACRNADGNDINIDGSAINGDMHDMYIKASFRGESADGKLHLDKSSVVAIVPAVTPQQPQPTPMRAGNLTGSWHFEPAGIQANLRQNGQSISISWQDKGAQIQMSGLIEGSTFRGSWTSNDGKVRAFEGTIIDSDHLQMTVHYFTAEEEQREMQQIQSQGTDDIAGAYNGLALRLSKRTTTLVRNR